MGATGSHNLNTSEDLAKEVERVNNLGPNALTLHPMTGQPHSSASNNPSASGEPGSSSSIFNKGPNKREDKAPKEETPKEEKEKEEKIDNSKYKEAIQDLYSFVKKKPLFGTKNTFLQEIWNEELKKVVEKLPTEASKDEAEGIQKRKEFDNLFLDIKAAAASSKAPSAADPSKAPSAADPSKAPSAADPSKAPSAAAEPKESAVGGGLFGDKKPIDVYVGFVDDLVGEKDKGKFRKLYDTLKREDMFKDGSMLFEWKDYKGNFKAVRIGDVKSISACKEDKDKLKKEIEKNEKKKEKEKGASKGGAGPVATANADASAPKPAATANADATKDKPTDASATANADASATAPTDASATAPTDASATGSADAPVFFYKDTYGLSYDGKLKKDYEDAVRKFVRCLLWSVKDDVFEKITGKHQKEKNKADAKAADAAQEQAKADAKADEKEKKKAAEAEIQKAKDEEKAAKQKAKDDVKAAAKKTGGGTRKKTLQKKTRKNKKEKKTVKKKTRKNKKEKKTVKKKTRKNLKI